MEFLETPFFDEDIYKMGVRFALNIFFLSLIVVFAVYPTQRRREFAFTAVMMNITVFFICFTLKKLELQLGMAIGLFAIFGVLRYRTDAIRVKEMTYLFIVIGIAVVNSLSNKKTSYLELLTVNTVIFAAALIKEYAVSRETIRKVTVQYDNLDMLGYQRRIELLDDLSKRTGIDVLRVQIRNIDLRKSVATLTIFYEDPSGDDMNGDAGDNNSD